jgi:hypothetical protein
MPRAADPSNPKFGGPFLKERKSKWRIQIMLIPEVSKAVGRDAFTNCDYCGGDAVIQMAGYGDGVNDDCNWCADCALQLVRKLSEDLCELLTRGGRHG